MSVPRESLLSIVPVAQGQVLVVVEDETARRDVLRHMGTLGVVAVQAESTERALELAAQGTDTLDCIVLGASAHGAFDLMRRLRLDQETAVIPVLLITDAVPGEVELLQIIESGAVDHLAKPLSGALLCAKVRAVCDRALMQRELRNKLRFALENAAHDPLTGLFNRRYFERRLREESAHARRHKRPFSIVMIDLDHFKLVNDTYGHEDGDRVLRHLAEVVVSSLREDDIACRYGGEEFVLLLRGTPGAAARVVANRLRSSLASRPIDVGPRNEPRRITFSAGVSAADERNAFLVEDIVARADRALYRAKRGGRNRVEME